MNTLTNYLNQNKSEYILSSSSEEEDLSEYTETHEEDQATLKNQIIYLMI